MAITKAKRWYISGRVQGVGFRYFVGTEAKKLGLKGWVKNLSDGRVEVLALGAPKNLSDLAAALYKGPAMSDVRSVEEQDATPEKCSGFEVR